MREKCLAYLKDRFLNNHFSDGPKGYTPTAEDWDRMPDKVKNEIVDLVLGFSTGGGKFEEIQKEFDKRVHSDTSFGMIVKGILARK